ncbi:glycoside hydrolase family 65 protein [Salisediminibacterium halotolerans]|uniref:glycoside hydrolase family 65 protein n=1 Tax=Salisediminibacterium halotolerans TaxID=517425 RepID=UPI000EB24BB9|nr:glycosyl hydrolase family 65 protein [Salisediminibacterium halotolerans]RLJ80895.1 alpha,alpha-trehalose phosphorylase [Actinophytocola xinjiangensis]RPE83919.1 alpha,alpha-trehalose phosphorylase [Salisediminibacterium halotolerans]TWG37839.1 alpha,alpha-trehalose phosphorylase [Salisediminibacterium halotolerans]GEL08456.1 glycosyl hydrolase [Salisediminibacterium halotolerans]
MGWTVMRNQLDEESLLVNESLFALGNGYLGVRGNFEEGYAPGINSIRGTYINAFHDEVPIEQAEKLHAFPEVSEKLVNIIDAQTIMICFDDEWFSLFDGDILDYKREINMDEGYSERRIRWRSPQGKTVRLHFRRLVSFRTKELFLQWIDIYPESACRNIRVISYLDGDVTNAADPDDPRVASGHTKRTNTTDVFQDGPNHTVVNRTFETRLETAASVRIRTSRTPDVYSCEYHGEAVVEDMTFREEEHIRVSKWTVYTDTYRHGPDVKSEARTIHNELESVSIADVLTGQREYLHGFWQSADIQVEGDANLQTGIRFNLFQLLQSVGKEPASNISAKGLSGEGYEGHYFWDTEIYMFPVFLMTEPSIAKNLLEHRYSLLPAAKYRAKEVGHEQGALFPWRTIKGRECSGFFPAGTAQYHISADIAYSFVQYYFATNDMAFMSEYGAEILVETARLWIDTGHEKDGQFRIDDVTGPDEYTCIINNNFYTNAMARFNLRWAVKSLALVQDYSQEAFDRLVMRLSIEPEEIFAFQRAADRMYLPYDPERDIHAQDDTFLDKDRWNLAATPKEKFPLLLHYHPLTLYRYQVCKQADTVLAHFLLDDLADETTMRKTYEYYEAVTTHDSSLSYCVFSIMAARLGDQEKALRYFSETARLDLDNTHGNTKDGLHMANMGGTWSALVYGFAGMRMSESGLSFRPSLPKSWTSLTFHIRYHGRIIQLYIDHDAAEYTLVHGEPITVTHRAAPIKLADGTAVRAVL